jgi:1-aminocyclopropane-1-carboxylate deaminase
LYIKRDDLVHPFIQGNKWRKLRPLLESVSSTETPGLITFGGPFSNHLQAVAQAGRLYGIKTVGILRGVSANLSNPTLSEASKAGMHLFPVPKIEYDAKMDSAIIRAIIAQYPGYRLLPEGGATSVAVGSCATISHEVLHQLGPLSHQPLFIAVPAGSGTTAAGILQGLPSPHSVLVFPAARYGLSSASILAQSGVKGASDRLHFFSDYTKGKFATPDPAILDLAHWFEQHYQLRLDPIYTSRMMFGIFDLLQKGFFPDESVIVAVHTGGLQGWRGFDLP